MVEDERLEEQVKYEGVRSCCFGTGENDAASRLFN
jgi:hypothetical protein